MPIKSYEDDYREIDARVTGGYVLVPVQSLLAVWWRMMSGELQPRDVRVWLAMHEVKARRGKGVPVSRQMALAEIASLTSVDVKRSVGRLVRLGVLDWSGTSCSPRHIIEDDPEFQHWCSQVKNRRRKLPFPRRMLRWLVGRDSRVDLGVAIAVLLRTLYVRDEQLVSGGRVSAHWVASVFGLGLRSVKASRSSMVEGRWLRVVPRPAREQRFGACIVVPLRDMPEAPGCTIELHDTAPVRESSKQRPSSRSNRDPEGRVGSDHDPSFQNVTIEDMRSLSRLSKLYDEATERGWWPRSESAELAFFATARSSAAAGVKNPPALFRWRVERGEARFTLHDEDVARVKLHRWRASRLCSNGSSVVRSLARETAERLETTRATGLCPVAQNRDRGE